MRIFITTCILFFATIVNAQTVKIDLAVMEQYNWVQADDSPNGLNTPMDAERDGLYKSNKLILLKIKKWGSLLENKTEFIVGNWEVKEGKIILYDLYAGGIGFPCEIAEFSKDSLVITYVDLYKTPRKIKLFPS